MPIDVERCLAGSFDEIGHSWSEKDVILYHLAVGAGRDPMDRGSLTYSYEAELQVLPSFGTQGVLPALMNLPRVPGFDVPLNKLLHAEQELIVHRPLPGAAEATTRPSLSSVADAGKGAIVVIEAPTYLAGEEEPLLTNRTHVFVRGEGGLDAPRAEATGIEIPDRDPDHSSVIPTLPWQALLYRLCGDMNPLHADPDLAKKAGFEAPILHGLCTFGLTLHAALAELCGGRVDGLETWRARFTDVVYPGEALRVDLFETGVGASVRVSSVERDKIVLLGEVGIDPQGRER